MDTAKYESNIRARGMKPVARFDYKGCLVLISDGFQRQSPFFPVPHYCTEWAFGRAPEKLDVAQPIQYEAFKDDLGFAGKVKERIAEARKQAEEFIDNCTNIREYAG